MTVTRRKRSVQTGGGPPTNAGSVLAKPASSRRERQEACEVKKEWDQGL
jgi:hypothetical protein